MNVVRSFCLLGFAISLYQSVIAQKKWDGEAGDGFWESALNWSDDLVPLLTEDVLLDNSILLANYTVVINGTTGTVQCRSLRIAPGMLGKIVLTIPPSNINSVALSTTGTEYTIQLDSGGELVNASGAASGAVLSIADSMKIQNGARYVHRTARGNAAIMNVLSAAPGTELGIVEFDVKVITGSYIVSLTNRVFGTLVFSASNNGGPIGYVSNGSNPVRVRGDLRINPQVSFSVGFDDTIRLNGNLYHEGTTLNLSNNGNPTVLYIEGNITTVAGSVITETNIAKPIIQISGNGAQQVAVNGSILNDVGFKLSKQGLVQLMAPLVLPYVLEMKRGILRTDAINMLILDSNATILADSTLLDSSFIDGPVRKLGLSATSHYLFPVGKQSKMRWIELKNATGDFTVEFFKSNPYFISSTLNSLHHISSIEYWTVESSGFATAGVELSFDNVNSGGVTDLSTLRVAQLNAGWTNQGNLGTTGSAGASGSVISNSISLFSSATKYFTLASTVSNQNPLPSKWIKLTVVNSMNSAVLKWILADNWHPHDFTLEKSVDGVRFIKERNIIGSDRLNFYSYVLMDVGKAWYRVCINEREQVVYSNVVSIEEPSPGFTITLSSTQVQQSVCFWIQSPERTDLEFLIYHPSGQMVTQKKFHILKGRQQLTIKLPTLCSGPYYLCGYNKTARTNSILIYRH